MGYFSSTGMRGKNIVGGKRKKIKSHIKSRIKPAGEPKYVCATPLGATQKDVEVSSAYANGPEVMDRK